MKTPARGGPHIPLRAHFTILALAAILVACAGADDAPERVLRVCADPNNLPFSDRQERGFENRIADVLAEELGARLEYTWWAQRRGFIRNTLRAGICDLVPGVPSSFELALPTRPYYRSTYLFVTRTRDSLRITSFDDPVLRTLSLGVHLVGDDYANTPPAHALSNRGIVQNVRGYTLYGDYSEPTPPARILDALVAGEIDVAIVWGPLAGYFATRLGEPLSLTPVLPQVELPFLPMVFDIAMAVRREDVELRDEIEAALRKRRPEIDAILAEYGVPRLDAVPAAPETRGGAPGDTAGTAEPVSGS